MVIDCTVTSPFEQALGGRWDDALLVDLSPSDWRFDLLKAQANLLAQLYIGTPCERYVRRLTECGAILLFRKLVDGLTGTVSYKLVSARFCRCPRCPFCNSRKMLTWRAKIFQAMPLIIRDYPKARFIHLVLTIKNPHVQDLRKTLDDMSKAWQRLVKLKAFPAVGWLRATEVTREHHCITPGKCKAVERKKPCSSCIPTEYAHPHFHCLLMVKPSYFTGANYLSHEKWEQLWRKSLRVDYFVEVSVRAIKDNSTAGDMNKELLEILKYTTKTKEDILTGKDASYSDQDWLLAMTEQLHNCRVFNPGGVFRPYLRDLEREPQDLIHIDPSIDDETNQKSEQVIFGWDDGIQRYKEVGSL